MKTLSSALRAFLLAAVAVLTVWDRSEAVPTFTRKYRTSCSTCHYAFPKLNAFGRAFQANGYRYPAGTDRDVTKEEPASLGSEGQKRAFPDAIWPADIAGASPLSFHVINRMNLNENDPKASFEFPHELEFLALGTIGETFSYHTELELEHASELAYGLFLQYDYRPQFHIQAGIIDPMPIPNGLRLTATHYNFGNIRAVSSGKSGGNPRWRFRDEQSGISIWGRTNGPKGRGGFRYALGLVNGQNNDDNDDINTPKDFFINASYKIGGLGEIGGTEGAESAASAFWLDNSVRVGGYAYAGKSQYDKFEDRFYLLGGIWDIWYSRLNLFGTYLYQKDKNVDGAGKQVITKAWFAEGDVVLYPWLIGIGRYEWTRVGAGVEASKTFIPGIAVMARANIKFTLQGELPLNDRDKRNWKYVVQIDGGF